MDIRYRTDRKKPYFARIRRKGHPYQSKSFETREEAEAFIARATSSGSSHFLADIIRSFGTIEDTKIANNLDRFMPGLMVEQFTTALAATYRDHRLSKVRPSTVRTELARISARLNTAIKEYELDAVNPIPMIRKPKQSLPPFHVISEEERANIQACIASEQVRRIVDIAFETGMRRSEIVRFSMKNLNAERRTLFLPHSKTGLSRYVPLTNRAVELLQMGEFKITPEAVTTAFRLAVVKAGYDKIPFHSIRHTRITQLARAGWSPMKIAMVSGHVSLTMLKRYTHLTPEDIAQELDTTQLG